MAGATTLRPDFRATALRHLPRPVAQRRPSAAALPRQDLFRAGDIAVERINDFGNLGVLRFNFLYPPFDKPAVRRALLPAIDQRASMQAARGTDPELYHVPAGVFTPGTPFTNDAGARC